MNSAARSWVESAAPWLLAIVVLMFTAWVYWPGISGPAMLDDRASITVLEPLDEHPELALDFVFGDRAGPLGRPVSMTSFVLERLYVNEGVSGNKKVNITLHLLNGVLVVWLVYLLLSSIDISASRNLAVLAGGLWLLSPLYVSTVLYAVQRMAMLASLFMVSACISYIYFRKAFVRGKPLLALSLLALITIFLLLAVYAKETAIVVLPVILLMEALWFGFRAPDGAVLKGLRRCVVGAILSGSMFVLLFFIFRLDWLIGSFRLRSFSLSERVLTESRILWDYIGQLLMPDVLRMGLYHDDIVVSTSLTNPAATLYAVLAWIVVLALMAIAMKWRRGRYLVFATAVFLIGHSTESTILALELYYEHRNYFPGIGVFLGIVTVLGFLFKKWPKLTAPALTWAWVFVLLLAMKTSSQVQIWSSAPLLYLNDVNSHPESFRTNANMASQLASVGALGSALEFSAKAHKLSRQEREGDYDLRDLSLSCAANQPLPAKRIASIGTVDANRPLSSVVTLNVLVRQLQNKACPDFDRLLFADRMAALFLADSCCGELESTVDSKDKASSNIYASLAVLENALERYDNALRYADKFLAGSPGNIRGLLMKLHFSTALQKRDVMASVMAQLEALENSGALTQGQRQTLALYKEN